MDTPTLRVISNNIYKQDAVGNFCFDIKALCDRKHIPCELYARSFKEETQAVRHMDQLFSLIKPTDKLFYCHSIYDEYLPKIALVPARRKLFYYHGITDPKWFIEHEPELAKACQDGYEQLAYCQSFDLFAANSRVSADRLSVHGVECIDIIPPKIADYTSIADRQEKPQETIFLYVGRLKNSKRIQDLLLFFAEYIQLDPEAKLWIVGGQDNQTYLNDLKTLETNLLSDHRRQVTWFGMVDDATRDRLYREATAYLSMSEDEGFCLPLVEAVHAALPVIAYGIPAVCEVMNGSGLCFSEKNFQQLATQAHALLGDGQSVSKMLQKQTSFMRPLLHDMKGSKLLAFIQKG